MSNARWVVVLAAGAVLAACASPVADTHLDVVFDICAPTVVVAPQADAARAAGIEQALAAWRAREVGSLTLAAADPEDAGVARIPLRFEDAAPAFHGYYDDELGVIYVNTDLADRDQLAVTVAHELGHAFGLMHVSAELRRSVMNPGNLFTSPTDEDAAELLARWGSCTELTPPRQP